MTRRWIKIRIREFDASISHSVRCICSSRKSLIASSRRELLLIGDADARCQCKIYAYVSAGFMPELSSEYFRGGWRFPITWRIQTNRGHLYCLWSGKEKCLENICIASWSTIKHECDGCLAEEWSASSHPILSRSSVINSRLSWHFMSLEWYYLCHGVEWLHSGILVVMEAIGNCNCLLYFPPNKIWSERIHRERNSHFPKRALHLFK